MIVITGSRFFLSYNYLHNQGDCYSMLHSVTEFSLNKVDNWTSDSVVLGGVFAIESRIKEKRKSSDG